MELCQLVRRCNVMHSFIEIDRNDAHLRIAKKHSNGSSSPASNLKEDREEQVFQPVDVIQKLHNVETEKLAQEVVKISTFKTLTTMDYEACIRNMGSGKKGVEEELKERFLSLSARKKYILRIANGCGRALYVFPQRHARASPKTHLPCNRSSRGDSVMR